MEDNLNTIFLNDCKSCKECCVRIPPCVCDYSFIQAIRSNQITKNEIMQLKIYHISEDKVDFAAKTWWIFPNENIITNTTIEENGFYDVLAIPRLNNCCPFLNDFKGCKIPYIKPYYCRNYPCYLENNELKVSSICSYAKKLDLKQVKSHLLNYSRKFLIYCRENKQDYSIQLKKLRDKYNIHEILYRSY